MEHNKSGEEGNHIGSTIWVLLTCDVIQFYLLGLLFFKGEVAHLTKMVAIPYLAAFILSIILSCLAFSSRIFDTIGRKTRPILGRNARRQKAELKELFTNIVSLYIANHLSSMKDADALIRNIRRVIEHETLDVELDLVSNKDLSREDLYHLGYHVKYYLSKDNDFGAGFIYKVFNHDFDGSNGKESILPTTIRHKLAVDGRHTIIPLPVSATRTGARRKAIALPSDIANDLQYYKSKCLKDNDSHNV